MTTTHKIRLTEAEEFFYRNGQQFSRALDEPATSGRTRGAVLLADAERTAEWKGWTYTWEIDPHADITPTDDYFVSGAEHWGCMLRDKDGNVLASLWSIDLGHDAYPDTHPYARVIQAELASEAID